MQRIWSRHNKWAKNQVGKLKVLDFTTYYKATVIEEAHTGIRINVQNIVTE